MKHIPASLPALLLLLPLSLFAATAEGPTEADLPKGDQTVVSVNATAMTASQLRKVIDWRVTQHPKQPPADHLQAFRDFLLRQTLNQFVIKNLMVQEANRRHIPLSEKEVDQAYSKMPVPEGMTPQQFLSQSPLGRDYLWADFTNSLRVAKLVTEERDRAPTQPEIDQMKQRVEQHRADRAGIANALRKQLLKGADFAQLAKEHSQCASAPQGGNLGRFRRGAASMPPEFEKAVFTQKPGDLGPVVETSYGFHLIQVLEHTPAGVDDAGKPTPEIAHARHILIKARPSRTDEQILELVKKSRPDTLVKKLRDQATIIWHIPPVPIP